MEEMNIKPGVTVAYSDDWFGAPWSDKETILMVHGMAESSDAWCRWVPALSERYRVLRIDLPGFGKSTVPEDYDFELATYVTDIATFLDRLELPRVHLVACKYGGSIAMSFASTFPARVLTLAIFGSPVTTPGLYHENGMSGVEALRHDREEWVDRTMGRRLGSTVSKEQIAWQRNLMVSTDLRCFIGTTAAIGHLALEEDLHKITAPSLIATTQGSALLSVEGVKEYQKKIPNSELIVLPGDCYHIAAVYPHECVQQLLRFLEAHKR